MRVVQHCRDRVKSLDRGGRAVSPHDEWNHVDLDQPSSDRISFVRVVDENEYRWIVVHDVFPVRGLHAEYWARVPIPRAGGRDRVTAKSSAPL